MKTIEKKKVIIGTRKRRLLVGCNHNTSKVATRLGINKYAPVLNTQNPFVPYFGLKRLGRPPKDAASPIIRLSWVSDGDVEK